MIELFLDNHVVSWQRNTLRTLSRIDKHAASPIVRCEHPWENSYVTVYGSVLRDDAGGFRMWYMAGAKGMRSDQCLCHAGSDDGLTWRKTMSNTEDYDGVSPTNILLGPDPNVHGPCVLLNQHDDDPDARYLLFYDSYPQYRPDMPQLEGMRCCYTAVSPDGLTWSPVRGRLAVPGKSDTGNSVVWDPRTRRYIAYLRGVSAPCDPYADPYGESQRVRYVRAAVSEDFEHWSPPIELMRADDEDGYPNHHHHQLSVTRRGGQFVGLLSIFHITGYQADRGGVTFQEFGDCDTQLVVSRDGLNWSRVADRQVFIPMGSAGAWDGHWIVTASEIVYDDDRMLFYYAGVDRPRGEPEHNYEIGVATLPRDRFQSIRPKDPREPAIIETRPLTLLDEGDLKLNVTPTAPDARITAEVCDFDNRRLEGFSQSDCDGVKTDGLDCVVRWGGRPLSAAQGPALHGRAARVRLYLQNCAMFAADIPHRDPWE